MLFIEGQSKIYKDTCKLIAEIQSYRGIYVKDNEGETLKIICTNSSAAAFIEIDKKVVKCEVEKDCYYKVVEKKGQLIITEKVEKDEEAGEKDFIIPDFYDYLMLGKYSISPKIQLNMDVLRDLLFFEDISIFDLNKMPDEMFTIHVHKKNRCSPFILDSSFVNNMIHITYFIYPKEKERGHLTREMQLEIYSEMRGFE